MFSILIGDLNVDGATVLHNFFQRIAESFRSESFSPGEDSNEYTSGDTGDTLLQNTNIPQHPVTCEKTETEVFIQPLEDADDPVNV